MRKSLIILICILVMGIVFISGCTSDDKTNSKSLTDSQSNQQSDAETPNLIIKPRDVSGLSLIEYSFRAFPKSSNYIYEGRFAFGAESGEIEYKDVLPLGTRNVGEISSWGDDSGRSIGIGLRKFDSNSELEDVAVEFTEMIEEL